MDVCLNPGGMAVHRLCLQLREPIDRVASLYDYRRSGKSGGYTPFAKMAGKEQKDWDFNTCVRRKGLRGARSVADGRGALAATVCDDDVNSQVGIIDDKSTLWHAP